jgi:hypothetical protein
MGGYISSGQWVWQIPLCVGLSVFAVIWVLSLCD